ncbi:MAG: energy transducer TonB [Steroidobacteraceae bacterium]
MASPAPNQSRHPAAPPSGTPAQSPASQPQADVTAVTTRDEFLLELGQALGGQAGIRPVDSLNAALESIASRKRGQVLVLDAREVPEVRAAVDAAHARAPHAVVVVFATEALERQVASALKGSKVFAVLPTPLDMHKTQAVFGSVIETALAARAAAHTARAAHATPAAAEPSIGAFRPQAAAAVEVAENTGGQKPVTLLLALAAVVLAVAGGTAWFFMHSRGTSQPAVAPVPMAQSAAPQAPAEGSAALLPPAPTADLSIVQGKVDDLLEKARQAMRERRYTEPAGDNALLYYRSAAAAEASNAEARDGLSRVAAVLAGRFDEALGGGRFEEAAQTLANFKAAAPADPRGAAFDARLMSTEVSKAFADNNYERVGALLRQAQQSHSVTADQLAKWRADLARRQEDAKVEHLAGLIEDRIHDGRLSDPADDSAKAYLHQLEESAPSNATTERVQHELTTAYFRKAHDAAAARNQTDEDRWLNEARAAGASAADISSFQRDVASARAKAAQADNDRLVQQARDALRDGRLTEPAQESAAYYLGQLQTNDPNSTALAQSGHDLAAKLLERARTAAQAGKSPDADLTQARHWGASPQDIAAVQQLAAPKAATVPDLAALAAKLKMTRSSSPEYPQDALSRQISGSVLLAFTVDPSGATRDISVVESTPPGVFDRAATNAVRHWRYAPTIFNGAPIAVPTRALLRFELPK